MDTALDELQMLVDAHRDVYTSLLELCEELDDKQWTAATGCPGWTVRDCLSHVVGLEAVMAGEAEPPPLAQEPAYVHGDMASYMERHVEARRELDIPDLLLEARDVFSRRLGQLELVTSLDEDVPHLMGRRGPAGRVFGIRVFDLWAHEQDIRRAVGVPGHLEGLAPLLSRDRLLRGLAHLLPKKLDHPEASLVIEVTGPSGIVWAVDLRSGTVIDPPPNPTVRLTLPFAHFVARACGRADAPDADLALVEGDGALAQRVLEDFAVTP